MSAILAWFAWTVLVCAVAIWAVAMLLALYDVADELRNSGTTNRRIALALERIGDKIDDWTVMP